MSRTTMLTEPPQAKSLKFETDRRGLRSNILFVLILGFDDVLKWLSRSRRPSRNHRELVYIDERSCEHIVARLI